MFKNKKKITREVLDRMVWQDAGQVNVWWCRGKPPPFYVCTAGGDYWTHWVKAPITA